MTTQTPKANEPQPPSGCFHLLLLVFVLVFALFRPKDKEEVDM